MEQTIFELAGELITQKNALVDNLNTKGAAAKAWVIRTLCHITQVLRKHQENITV